MPKAKPNAIKQTRKFLQSAQIKVLNKSDSDTETDSSTQSEEYSHIPINHNFSLEGIILNEDSNKMDVLSNQLNSIMNMLENLSQKQNEQQLILDSLISPPNPTPEPTQVITNIESFFRIPDPIKSIPHFDGNSKQLSAWITTTENTLNVFKNIVTQEQFKIYVTAVINKIEGKVRDIICLAGNPQSFEEIKQILTTALGDRQELTYYKAQLWQHKMTEKTNIHKYYQKCKEITQNIKSLAKQKEKYRNSWDAINAFIDEDALAAFLSGLREPYFGYAQAACPTDLEAAYAFVCKFRSTENIANHMETNTKNNVKTQNYQKKNYTYQRPFINKENWNNQPNEQQTQRERTSFETNKVDRGKPDTNNTKSEQMDVGSSGSKLTLNRKIYNNELINENHQESESGSENSDEEQVDVNFWETETNRNNT